MNGVAGDNTENDLLVQFGDLIQATDFDGDTVTAPTGAFEITIDDDMPTVFVTAPGAADAVTVDETFLNTNASANFADNFSSTSNFGADGAGTLGSAYSLNISASGANSGLVDVATGQAVLLSVNGGAVEGHTAVSNALVFTVTVDGTGLGSIDPAMSRPIRPTPTMR